jgi:hypothetical protein
MNKLDLLVKREIQDTLYLARHGKFRKQRQDSLPYRYTKGERLLARLLADRAIRIHDRRYNDIVGFLAIKAAMPVLLPIFKSILIGGLTSAATATIKETVTKPIIGRLMERGKEIIANRGDDGYIQSLLKGFKEDMTKLWPILQKEGGFLASKVMGIFSKIRGLFPK